jgi:transposase
MVLGSGRRISGMEARRYRVIQDVLDKRLTQEDAAIHLELSVRQVRRLVRGFKHRGMDAIVHGLVGKKSNHSLEAGVEQKILDLWTTKYRAAGLNFNHFTEKLNEVETLEVSREKVRTLLRARGVADKPLGQGRKHRKARVRRERFGELIQQDTSPHDWLGIGTEFHAVVAVDDATSRLLFLKLYEADGTLQNMEAMRSVILKYGLPMSYYTDAAAWFKVTRHFQGTILRRENTVYQTQIERALDELGIELIIAGSPQAKGRVERANGTLQDRLIAELKLRKLVTLESANQYIQEEFIEDYNARFGKDPYDQDFAFIPFIRKSMLDQILCFKFQSQVQNDNTVSKSERYKIQILPTASRLSWAKANVEVLLRIDGQVEVRHPTAGLLPIEVLDLKIPKEFKHPHHVPTEQDISILQN